MGRPAFEITQEVIEKSEKLAAQGLTLEQISKVLGICYQTLNEKRKEFNELSEAIKRGQAKGVAQVTNKLYGKALEGDNTAMIFYLKNRDSDNWKDRVESRSEITIKEKDPAKRKSRIEELLSKTKG
tara:strand:- start:566 stop:946 length:381 start_codon:yes stop_codon:yes gene_type:complete